MAPSKARPEADRRSTVLYLTTTGRRSGRPRRIEIWFTRRNRRYYVIAETGEDAQWVRNLRADPRVAWHVGKVTYRGQVRLGQRPGGRARTGSVGPASLSSVVTH